jgi:hypothetical protein
MTNRGVQIGLDIIETIPDPYSPLVCFNGVLKCSYRHRLGIAVGIRLIQSKHSEDEFYRHPTAELMEIDFETFQQVKQKNIFLLGSGQSLDKAPWESLPQYHIWVDKRSLTDNGIEFLEAGYCMDWGFLQSVSLPTSWDGDCLAFPDSTQWKTIMYVGLYLTKDKFDFVVLVIFSKVENQDWQVRLGFSQPKEVMDRVEEQQCIDETIKEARFGILQRLSGSSAAPTRQSLKEYHLTLPSGIVTAQVQKTY